MSVAFRTAIATAAIVSAAFPAVGQDRQASGTANSTVSGVVSERGTHQPIQGAAVQLIAGSDTEALMRLSDESGRFTIPRVPAGRCQLRIERIGYETVEDSVEFPANSEVQLRVELVTRAVQLEPLVVVASRPLDARIPGWDRRRRLGLGRYITRKEIERSKAPLASEVLRQVPSVQLIPKGPHGNDVLIRGCRPLLFVDGMGIDGVNGGFALDEILGTDQVEAIEVYTAGHIPPEFGFGRNPCGAVVVWTRRPDVGAGKGRRQMG